MSATATHSEPRPAGVFLKDAGGLPPKRTEPAAYYEGAQWKAGEQGWIFGSLQDQRLDASAMTRMELMRKSRAFERNNAFQNRLADIFEQYTVGAGGLSLVSASKDATTYFNQWSKDCDALGLMDFGTIQTVAARDWFVDGECFLVKVIINGRLKIQIVEGHRVYTPPDLAGGEGVTIVDGVTIDAAGRKTGVWVNVGIESAYATTSNEQWKFVRADDVYHIYEPSRAAMYRGLPFCYPVMNDLNDLDDLQKLVNQVAKQAATIGNVTTNRTGELSTKDARRVGIRINTANATGQTTPKSVADYYQVKFGAQEIALQHGDSIKQFQAERPNLAEREHWDYLTGKICIGQGIAKQLVWPYSIQGTVARADNEVSAAFFRSRSTVLQCAVRWVFFNVIRWAQDYDRQVIRGGFDFTGFENVVVRAPRSPNVDVGRNSKALVNELESGLRTFQDIYAEAGQDWTEQLTQKAKEAKFIKQLATSEDVDANDIALRVSAGINANKAAAEETETEDETA
jgi:capsid protein